MPKRGTSRFRGTRLSNTAAYLGQMSTIRIREASFAVQSTTSGTAGIIGNAGNVGATPLGDVQITPYALGGRAFNMAAVFSEWRVRSIRFEYEPAYVTASGVVDNEAGTTTPTYDSRAFAWGVERDPAIALGSTSSIYAAGGRYNNTSRKSSLVYTPKDGEWFYTTTTAAYASATSIDFRLVCPCVLWFRFSVASTTQITYGLINVQAVLQFRHPNPTVNPVGMQLVPISNSLTSEITSCDVIERKEGKERPDIQSGLSSANSHLDEGYLSVDTQECVRDGLTSVNSAVGVRTDLVQVSVPKVAPRTAMGNLTVYPNIIPRKDTVRLN